MSGKPSAQDRAAAVTKCACHPDWLGQCHCLHLRCARCAPQCVEMQPFIMAPMRHPVAGLSGLLGSLGSSRRMSNNTHLGYRFLDLRT
mmetsp:Transcript_36606/g.84181  ORF Transcript_36606/g.84181 Transcript_36606/m.84181 type:complete len:88 (-) Transcript_36606:4-267(-)